MILNEFIEVTSRLEQYFGKEYTNEQRQIMFEELNKMSLQRYQRAVAICIKTCKYLPKIADILQSANESDNDVYETKRQYEQCKICGSRGLIRYYKILQENNFKYEFACRCICKNAENYNKKIPTYEEIGVKPNDMLIMNFE